jgi:hypothetical protein
VLLLEKADKIVADCRLYDNVFAGIVAESPIRVVGLRLFHQESHIEKCFGEG